MSGSKKRFFHEHAIEIAPRIWWVGVVLPDDVFQCHCYLIEQGDQSVLIDPGSLLTFAGTLEKIEQVLPFDHIRYFVCQHQDPDIAASLPLIDNRLTRNDAVVICHSRAAALLKHYDLDIPFHTIDSELNWKLPLTDRTLEFVFTPYAHFPGAFCTFDRTSGSLFSSDLFGGFTDDFSLYAESERYFECLRPFHEHYMPSNVILRYALERIKALPVSQILPQHGSIIPKELVPFMITHLMDLDCGLFLHENTMSEVIRLSEQNKTLRDINDVMILSKSFKEIANGLLSIVKRFLPATSLEFYHSIDEDHLLHLTSENQFHGKKTASPDHLKPLMAINMEEWLERYGENGHYLYDESKPPALVLPLSNDEIHIIGIAIIHLVKELPTVVGMDKIISRLRAPLQVALERETLCRAMEMDRLEIYNRASRDPLTSLYTRFYMQDTVQRILDLQKREQDRTINLALLDIDFFKRINDTYGHQAGDLALQEVASVVLQEVRSSDFPVRLGGEEFAIFLVGTTGEKAMIFSERLRTKIEQLTLPAPLEKETLTVSIGMAVGSADESLEEFIERADKALYKAKHEGRNQVQQAA